MVEKDMTTVADFLHRAVQIAVKLQAEAGSKLLKDFVRVATEGDGEGKKELEALSADVEAFAVRFPLPGIVVSSPSFSVAILLRLGIAGHFQDQETKRAIERIV